VLMADGGEKRIDEIEVGDVVWAEDPLTGEHGSRSVTAVIVGAGDKALVDVTIASPSGESTITATANHPFWGASARGWLVAAALTLGMVLTTADGGMATVAGTHAHSEHHRVYNLTVDGLHTLFVVAGDESVLVHNAGGNCGGREPVAKGKEGVKKSEVAAKA